MGRRTQGSGAHDELGQPNTTQEPDRHIPGAAIEFLRKGPHPSAQAGEPTVYADTLTLLRVSGYLDKLRMARIHSRRVPISSSVDLSCREPPSACHLWVLSSPIAISTRASMRPRLDTFLSTRAWEVSVFSRRSPRRLFEARFATTTHMRRRQGL